MDEMSNLGRAPHFVAFSCKSVHELLCNPLNKQNKPTAKHVRVQIFNVCANVS